MRLKNFSLPFGGQIFKALSDEARIRIMHLLYKNKELTISDLEHIARKLHHLSVGYFDDFLFPYKNPFDFDYHLLKQINQ